MSLVLLIADLVLVVAGAEVFFDGLVSTARTRRLPPFVLTLVVSGFEVENLAAGIAANAKGLGDTAAGTFLGATTFLALGVAGLSALVSPIRAALPLQTFVWAAAAPLPTFLLARDGMLSRIDGALLLLWFAVALTGLARAGKGLPLEESEEEKRHPIVRMLVGLACSRARENYSAKASSERSRVSGYRRLARQHRHRCPAWKPKKSRGWQFPAAGVAATSRWRTFSAPSFTSSRSTPGSSRS